MITTSNGEQFFFVAHRLIGPKPCKRREGEYVKNVGVYCTRYIVNDQPITLEFCVFCVYLNYKGGGFNKFLVSKCEMELHHEATKLKRPPSENLETVKLRKVQRCGGKITEN